jgi:hypothetical protein
VLVDAEIANSGTVAELNARVDAAISMVLNDTIHSSTL